MNFLEQLSRNKDIVVAEQLTTAQEYSKLVDTFRIRYKNDGFEIEGFASIPKAIKGSLPVIIFNRGGNREFGALIPEKISRYASYGFIVFGSQYRGNCGGTGREEFGGKDVYDSLKLIDIATSITYAKKQGVYMVGHSRGGMMTYIACTLDNRIKAAAIGSGLADSVMMYNTREDSMKDVYHELVGGSPEEYPEEFYKRSAVCWADKIIPPVLICQGANDWRVVPEQAYKMDRALESAHKEHKLIVYGGADHSLEGTTYIQDVTEWLLAHKID